MESLSLLCVGKRSCEPEIDVLLVEVLSPICMLMGLGGPPDEMVGAGVGPSSCIDATL